MNLLTLSEKYIQLLKQRDSLQRQLVEIKQSELSFEKGLVDAVQDIKKFAAYLQFETSGSIRVTSISQANPKYERCVRALSDNANSVFFQPTPSPQATEGSGIESSSGKSEAT